ncbi:P-loop NTPase fold protein [Massilia sp. 9I]|uniref:KAP family P-loop NTPase fold protein n=1 Tax=Massilia sp. 9I TaxID=2653152 RepID=UPI0012F0A1C5|nr:P-loop NTPase fold protein [Massilia sp. 9I]VXB81287.1 KAP family P-loop domain-containing protein [Massilia sp. 9I]
MNYRIRATEVPDDDPFRHDALNRKQIVEFVAGVVSDTGDQPLVLAIDSPYGTGKSVFVDMVGKVLQKRNFQTVYFNAWKADHVSDPLIAMVAALDEAFPKAEGSIAGIGMKEVKKFATAVLKRTAILGVKLGTGGLVDLPDGIEGAVVDAATDATNDLIEEFAKEEQAAKCFRAEVEKVVASLPKMQKEPTLVFFIDELDRCRPDFAMSLLERIKHMFDVPNLAFVLSIDKKQLEAVTAAVYGEKIDAAEYLRKFIDLEFGLPAPSRIKFINNAINHAGIADKLQGRRNERDTIVRLLGLLADIYDMRLRAIERCIIRLKLVLAATGDQERLETIHLGLLIVLRSVDKEMFDKIAFRKIGYVNAMNYFRERAGVYDIADSVEWNALEAVLIVELAGPDEKRTLRDQHIAIINNDTSPAARNKAQHLLSLTDSYSMPSADRKSMLRVAAAIDIAADIRD